MSHLYRVHGKNVYVNVPVEILAPGVNEPVHADHGSADSRTSSDVAVRVVRLDALRTEMPDLPWADMVWEAGLELRQAWHRHRLPWLAKVETPHGSALYMYSGNVDHQFVALIAAHGRRIDVGWVGYGDVTEKECVVAITTYWLPTLLGIALRMGQNLVLHGNAVDLNGRALVWCGEKGAGKSTLAAAFVAAGHHLLADDQVVLRAPVTGAGDRSDNSGALFEVEAGIAQMRLWTSSGSVLQAFPMAQQLAIRYPLGDAIKGLMDGRVNDAAWNHLARRPLAAVLILGPRDPDAREVVSNLLPRFDAVHGLLANRFGGWTLPVDANQNAVELATLTRLAQTIPVYRVTLPDAIERLPHVITALVEMAEDPTLAGAGV